MNYKPFKHKDDPFYRVVYRANGRWVAQRLVPITDLEIDRRVNDPWHDLHAPKDNKDDAIRIMYKCCPLKA